MSRIIERIVNKGRTKYRGPDHLVLPPRREDVEEALERMRKVQHVNRHVVETEWKGGTLFALVELLYLEKGSYGETFHDFLRRNHVSFEHIPLRERTNA